MAPATPISRPSAPVRAVSQLKKGCPSSRSMDCAWLRTSAACRLQLSASRLLSASCSP